MRASSAFNSSMLFIGDAIRVNASAREIRLRLPRGDRYCANGRRCQVSACGRRNDKRLNFSMSDAFAFLLSPARSDGPRARVLTNPGASFDLALKLRSAEGAELGDVFSFLSGLYFRGKLTYARALTPADRHAAQIKIITTNRGLRSPAERITRDDLVAFSNVDIANGDERYLAPLRRDAELLATALPASSKVVLLGSIATGKYVDTLLAVFGERLLFPVEFVGRGDMSRGGLLLRSSRTGTQLTYVPVAGAVRRGSRPPKLEKLPRSK